MAVEYIHHYQSEQARPSKKLALQINNMQVRHSNRVILQGVNLALEEGTYACLLGESGSGKSTLLAAIAGMLKPSEGIVKLHGETVSSTQGHWLAPEKRGIGMVFQEPALWPHMRVLDNVLFPLKSRGMVPDRQRALALLEKMDLPAAAAERRPHELSGGQRQRVAIARAIIARPRLVLLDEPLSALDHSIREEIRTFLRALFREEGITALHVTHDPEEAFDLGTRIGFLGAGRLAQWDSPEGVYRCPATETVARLSGPVRFLPVMVTAVDAGHAHLSVSKDSLRVPAHPELRPGPALLALRPEAVLCDSESGARATVIRAQWSRGRYLLELELPEGDRLLSYSATGRMGIRYLKIHSEDAWCLPPETELTTEEIS
ncbi:ABC transporter ATP-binding protein [Acidithiobacillus sulfuriphilus]|uniref:ABC transporter ATP-binding protein n=1 Tax=Acidithiobacillus sulfuriphilus TaxID=1867749 RepID=UPI003F5DFED9